MTKLPKDNFSRQAQLYQKFRPVYPDALYQHVLALVPDKERAWDVGTGNAQVAQELAKHFQHVDATDISEKQLSHAPASDRITYHLLPAEKTSFPDNKFDLITVGQAVHWFEFNAFFQEVQRVANPEAVLALWGYGLLSITPEVDAIIQHFYTQVIGPYWDPERRYIDEAYATIPFPLEELPAYAGAIETIWRFAELEGYLNTWSSVQAYLQQHQKNPVEACLPELKQAWGQAETHAVRFPIFSRIGRVHK